MRYRILLLLMLLGVATVAPAQVNIGINFSAFPGLVRVPGYPVYYAPQQAANYFFYDGMYWVYQDDYWYSSSWFNGPWWRADPQYVPEYILRVPVRYYRRPPAYFRGWQGNAPPRWGEHWGNDWEQHRRGWDQWDRKAAPAPAPIPVYQKQYSGTRYPKPEQQQALQGKNYRYQPKDALVREHFEPKMRETPAPVARDRQPEPQRKNAEPQRKDSEPQRKIAEPQRKDSESQRKDSGKDERSQKSGPSNPPDLKSEPAAKQQPPRPQAATPREPAAAPREQPTLKPAAQPQRPQPQAVTPREPAPAAREQQAPRSADQPQRPQPQAAPPREPAAAPREQPAPKAAAQPQRPQPQAAPQREQPAPKSADQPQRSQPRAPANKPDRNEEKAAEKGR